MAEEPEARDGRPVPVLAASLTERAVPHPECRRRATGARAQLEPRQLKSAASGGDRALQPAHPRIRSSAVRRWRPARQAVADEGAPDPSSAPSVPWRWTIEASPRRAERGCRPGVAAWPEAGPGAARSPPGAVARPRTERDRPPADPEAGSRPLRPARRAFHGSFVRARRAPGPGSPPCPGAVTRRPPGRVRGRGRDDGACPAIGAPYLGRLGLTAIKVAESLYPRAAKSSPGPFARNREKLAQRRRPAADPRAKGATESGVLSCSAGAAALIALRSEGRRFESCCACPREPANAAGVRLLEAERPAGHGAGLADGAAGLSPRAAGNPRRRSSPCRAAPRPRPCPATGEACS